MSRRLRIWELAAPMHCSIVGTCLAPDDVRAVLRQARLERDPDALDYAVHGFLVREAGGPTAVARAMQAVLDRKYAGAVRQVQRLDGEAAMLDYWAAVCRKGLVAGPYWALMTLADATEPVRQHIFGEVHMLSHFMGGLNRRDSACLWAAECRIEELVGRLERARRRAEERELAHRAQLEVLEAELAALRQQLAARARPAPGVDRRSRAKLDKQARRLAALRAERNALRQANQRLEAALAGAVVAAGTPAAAVAAPPDAGGPQPCRLTALRCMLYVGGRPGSLPHLRAGAERHSAELIHHDGGVEESITRLDDLVPRADVVFCPVDCVSHGACLRARALCRRHAKPFVPLRSASASHFARRIAELESAMDPKQREDA